MKTPFRTKAIILMMGFALLATSLRAEEYYVVIGAFSQEANARRFTGTVRQFFKEVTYSFNESKKLYYVHVMKTAHKEEARNWSLYLRHEKGFRDAWVLTETESQEQQEIAGQRTPTQRQFNSTITASASSAAPVIYEDDDSALANSSSKTADAHAWTVDGGFAFIRNIGGASDVKRELAGSAANLFSFIVEDHKGKVVPAEVMLVNFEKVRKLATFEPGEHVAIKGTKTNQMVTFVCDVLGYSQETRMFNLDHLSRGKDIAKNEQGVWEVRIKLKKIEMHDIAVMNKTFFYKDAAILESTARKELDELVTLMKTNPGYNIILHSHCNPGPNRTLKMPAAESNYFDIARTVEKMGSDKTLTKQRAEVIKRYLVTNGIDKKRIRLVAWGSMEMIVKEGSQDAHINERIEVEFTAL